MCTREPQFLNPCHVPRIEGKHVSDSIWAYVKPHGIFFSFSVQQQLFTSAAFGHLFSSLYADQVTNSSYRQYIVLIVVKMGIGDYSPGSIWYYAPNKAAPVVFIILFSVSGALHAWQTM